MLATAIDDAEPATFNAAIAATIPAHPSRTHYAVFRDYWFESRRFRVTLQGTQELRSCSKDSDCVVVDVGCCHVGDYTAVRTDKQDVFEASKNCTGAEICPLIKMAPQGESAICDFESQQCQVVLAKDMDCGGHRQNPHFCPDGWLCVGAGLPVDATGFCVEQCGGFGGFACPGNLNCVDNPTDDCDPANGGADCGGICIEDEAVDCRILGCPTGPSSCQQCWGSWQCMADGVTC